MTRSTLIAAVSLALGLGAALSLAACGGGSDAKLLPGTTADQINSNVGQVRQLAAEGECVDAQDAALEVSDEVTGLEGIDPKLKRALEEGAERLNQVVLTCTEETTEEDTEETPPPETTEPEPAKPEKKKPKKEEPEPPAEEQEETEEPPKSEQEPPKGEEKGHEEEVPPAEPPSGGIGPSGETGAAG